MTVLRLLAAIAIGALVGLALALVFTGALTFYYAPRLFADYRACVDQVTHKETR